MDDTTLISHKFMGKEFNIACLEASKDGYIVREARRDGEHLMLTMDYRDDRFNVATQDNIVIEVLSVG